MPEQTQSAEEDTRPLYCADDEILEALKDDDPCPKCGASVANLRPCGAVYPRPEPKPDIIIEYVYKPTGEVIR